MGLAADVPGVDSAGPFLLTAGVPADRVGARLAELRTRAGLSRRELASRLDVNRWWVRRWESGSHRLPDPVVRRALTELHLSLEELIPQRLPVRYDPTGPQLVLGTASVPLQPGAGNAGVLAAFVALVEESRTVSPAGPWELRTDDLAVLAELLDLEAHDLDGALMHVFGLDAVAARAVRARMRRQRVLVATAMATGFLTVTPTAGATDVAVTATSNVVNVTERRSPVAPWAIVDVSDPSPDDAPMASVTSLVPLLSAPEDPADEPAVDDATTGDGGTVDAPPPLDRVDAGVVARPAAEIGEAVTIERADVPVVTEIGDAVTLERDDVEPNAG